MTKWSWENLLIKVRVAHLTFFLRRFMKSHHEQRVGARYFPLGVSGKFLENWWKFRSSEKTKSATVEAISALFLHTILSSNVGENYYYIRCMWNLKLERFKFNFVLSGIGTKRKWKHEQREFNKDKTVRGREHLMVDTCVWFWLNLEFNTRTELNGFQSKDGSVPFFYFQY